MPNILNIITILYSKLIDNYYSMMIKWWCVNNRYRKKKEELRGRK